jgi:Ca2+-binding RTX toxin-like protein
MRTTGFDVTVTGRADGGRIRLRFALDGAREANDELYCGANYYGFATDDTRLADSLELVQPADGIDVEQAHPRITPLRKLETLGDEFDSRVNLHEWEISIRAPDRPQDAGPGASPGGANRPAAAGVGGSICTIEGTAGRDRLRGTRGNDVICAYGGGDRIDGRGGHDLVYAGPGSDRVTGGGGLDVVYGNAGRDRLNARDGRRDRLDGGAGRDGARVDAKRDRVRGVEQIS